MLPSWVWVAVGIVAYAVVAEILDRSGFLPDYINISGPLTTIHTQWGKKFLDALANRHRRLWALWGDAGVLLSVVVMVGAVVTLGQSALSILISGREQVISNPQNMLVIPGVNDFLPLTAAPEIVFGLLVGLIVHEGGHGLFCRHGDIEIDSLGVALFAVIPLGAFVEPDEEDRDDASSRSQLRMFAAGVTNNFAISIFLLVLLFGPLSHAFAPVAGVPVGTTYSDSPAERAGIGEGDVITAVNGQLVANTSEYRDALEATDEQRVRLAMQDGTETVVERELIVTRVVVRGDIDINPGDRITSVNGTEIRTLAGLEAAVKDKERIALTTADGNTATLHTGAYVAESVGGGPIVESGVPKTDYLIVGFDGDRITSTDDLDEALDRSSPGDRVTVRVRDNGTVTNHTVTLGGSDGDAYLGVNLRAGINGVAAVDVGVDQYPAAQMLSLVQGEGGILAFGRYILVLLLVPLLGVIEPEIGYNFAGFVGTVPNYYTVTGPLAVLGGGAFTLFNLAFWTAWINIQLGFFNTIPTYPLDGGHILRTLFTDAADRAPFEIGDSTVRQATRLVFLVVVGILAILVFW